MSLVQILFDTARADSELLATNRDLGDNFEIPREIEFVLLAKDERTAKLVRDFIDDNRYGVASVQRFGERYGIMVVTDMAPRQNALHSVSGLMACIAHLFGVAYDGLSYDIKRFAL